MIPINIIEYDAEIAFQIGQRIQQKRVEKNLVAADVASYLEISAKQLSKIENGNANCTIKHLYVLHQLLDCSIDYLLTGIDIASKVATDAQKAIEEIKMIAARF